MEWEPSLFILLCPYHKHETGGASPWVSLAQSGSSSSGVFANCAADCKIDTRRNLLPMRSIAHWVE